jgi:hypothetical protein
VALTTLQFFFFQKDEHIVGYIKEPQTIVGDGRFHIENVQVMP